MATKKSQPQQIEGGNIVLIKFTSENKPCDTAIAKLLNTVTEGEYNKIQLNLVLDVKSEEFLDEFTFKNAMGQIRILEDGELKDWYLEKVKQLKETLNK